MVLPHNLRAPVSMMKPRPVGISDRSGKMYYLDEMVWQFQWSGNALVNQRILVGPDEVDTPSEFLRSPILGPEPAPLPNARPWYYAYQNQGGTAPLTSVQEILPDGDN